MNHKTGQLKGIYVQDIKKLNQKLKSKNQNMFVLFIKVLLKVLALIYARSASHSTVKYAWKL